MLQLLIKLPAKCQENPFIFLPKSDFSYIWHMASINFDFWAQIYKRYVYTELFNEQRGHKYICRVITITGNSASHEELLS